jgi:type III secretion protein U
MSDEKPFPPSEKKLRKLRRQGTIVRAPLLVYAIGWFIALGYVSTLDYRAMMTVALGTPMTSEGLAVALVDCSALAAQWSAAGLLLLAVGAGFVELAQARFTLALDALTPQPPGGNALGRIGQNLKTLPAVFFRFFVFALPVAMLVGTILIGKLVQQDHAGLIHLKGSSIVVTGWLIGAVALLVLGIVEWCNAHRRFQQQHGMTLDELRREHREAEGDPHTKAERKALHSWLARGELERRVRSSRVILYRRQEKVVKPHG